MSFEIIGTLLGVIVQGLMLSIYGSSTSCDQSLQSTEQTRSVDYETQANATGKDKLVSKNHFQLCCHIGFKFSKNLFSFSRKKDI
jgi:hypothetical protein